MATDIVSRPAVTTTPNQTRNPIAAANRSAIGDKVNQRAAVGGGVVFHLQTSKAIEKPK